MGWEQILITVLGLAGSLLTQGKAEAQPMTPEIEEAWNKVIAAKEEAMDAAAKRAKDRG